MNYQRVGELTLIAVLAATWYFKGFLTALIAFLVILSIGIGIAWYIDKKQSKEEKKT